MRWQGFVVIICLLFSGLFGQYCIPSSDCSVQDYIDGVQFNTISNMNSGCFLGGYADYTSIYSTTVAIGFTYNLKIVNNPSYNEYYGVWIDFNGNGNFNDPGEFVYSGSIGAGQIVNVNITIPTNATVGTTRMRIRCSWGTSLSAFDACTNVSFGETEDYGISIMPPPPPEAGFTSSGVSCTGFISFTDTSHYAASWEWYFGDGSSSNVQNPSHTYTTSGTYNVTLVACNMVGCDSAYESVIFNPNPSAGFSYKDTTCSGVVKFTNASTCASSYTWFFGDGTSSNDVNPIHFYSNAGSYYITLVACQGAVCDTHSASIPVIVLSSIPFSCTPPTSNYCCGFGITHFKFAGINNISSDGSAGYEDFSCITTTVYPGRYYPIYVKTDVPTYHKVNVWIDFNGDGTLSSPELIYSSAKSLIIQDSVYIPPTILYNTPLRLRVWADYYLQSGGNPCDTPSNGQVEDYTIKALPNPYPPEVNFFSPDTVTCTGIVRFYDQTLNLPQGWIWYFGDGTTSSLQNPVHTYNSSGIYDVKLIAYNNNGLDTLEKIGYITVKLGGAPPPPSCKPQTQSYCCDYGIYGVTINKIQVTSGGGWEGYQDYSCVYQDTLTAGIPYTITINTGNTNPADVMVFLDTNNNGVFETGELLFFSSNKTIHTGVINFSSIPAGYMTPIRLRIIADYVGAQMGPCISPQWGQIEDYSIVLVPPPPVASFTIDSNASCPGPVSFFSTSTYAQNYLWDFGDGTTSSLSSPTHNYYTPGIYVVYLTVSNYSGQSVTSDTLIVHPGFCKHTSMQINSTITLTDCAGYIYDSGGPSSNYLDNSDSKILISPPAPKKIKLVLLNGSYENTKDSLIIYNGSNQNSPKILVLSGSLPSKIKLYSSSNSLLIHEKTNATVNYPGFSAYFYCTDTILSALENSWTNNPSFSFYISDSKLIMEIPPNIKLNYCAIYNTYGQKILHKIPKNSGDIVVIDISNLNSGLYLFIVDANDGEIIINKFVIE